jgi:hypothetical protein
MMRVSASLAAGVIDILAALKAEESKLRQRLDIVRGAMKTLEKKIRHPQRERPR